MPAGAEFVKSMELISLKDIGLHQQFGSRSIFIDFPEITLSLYIDEEANLDYEVSR